MSETGAVTHRPDKRGSYAPENSPGELSEDSDEREAYRSYEEALEKRVQDKTGRARVDEFEQLDEDRRSEILHILREITTLDDEEWMSPDYEKATVDVDWESIREHKPAATHTIDNLETKYDRPASLFKLSVTPEEDMPFHPGDYFSLKLTETPGIDTSGHQIPDVREETAWKETPFRVYSIASSPDSEHVEFYIRRIPNQEVEKNSLTPVLAAKLEELDEVVLRGPDEDELSLEDYSDRDMVYIANGTGMAPHKSMIEFVFDNGFDSYKGEEREVFMIQGSPTEDDVPGDTEFEELEEQHGNFHYTKTLSREEDFTDWDGETGYVQSVLNKYIQNGNIDLENSEFYVCGSGVMAEGVRNILGNFGFDTDNGHYQQEIFY